MTINELKELLDEFLEVASRPKLRRFFSTSDIEEFLETIDEYASFVKVHTKVEVCRDPKDNFLLSLSVDGKADFLLTATKIYWAFPNLEEQKS